MDPFRSETISGFQKYRMNQFHAFHRAVIVSYWKHVSLAQLLHPVVHWSPVLQYVVIVTTSRSRWGFSKDRWEHTCEKAVCSLKEESYIKSTGASCHSFFVIMLFQNSQCARTCLVIGVSALESNSSDCRAKSAEHSKNAWIQCWLLLSKTWPWNHMVSASLIFLRIWRHFN